MTDTATRERPILFSGAMVRAILSGQKTQTRRVIKPQPPDVASIKPDWMDCGVEPRNQRFGIVGEFDEWPCPYGGSGERLWVRETWAPIGSMRPAGYFSNPDLIGKDFWYRASDCIPTWGGKWRPSIHMPRIASRLTLEVTGVRVERVQDITEDDAKAEGVEPGCLTCGENCLYTGGCGYCRPSYRDSFIFLWDSINANRGFGWDENPYVWVVEFKRCFGRV